MSFLMKCIETLVVYVNISLFINIPPASQVVTDVFTKTLMWSKHCPHQNKEINKWRREGGVYSG